jgi:hypothetical protein
LREGVVSRSAALKEKNVVLQQENDELRELYGYLRFRSEPEAYEIYRRIRTSNNPIEVLNFIKQADMLLMNPSPWPDRLDARLERWDLNALRNSVFKVPARPWTVVAGDGMVSELISAFFKWDDTFSYPFIDRESFLMDMQKEDPKNAKYCSAFLVNVICAVRCVSIGLPRNFNWQSANFLTSSLQTLSSSQI